MIKFSTVIIFPIKTTQNILKSINSTLLINLLLETRYFEHLE